MSSNTLRGIGQPGEKKGGQGGGDGGQSPSTAGSASSTSKAFAGQGKAAQELTPEELRERIKEELRKIRSLDAAIPGVRSLDATLPGSRSLDATLPGAHSLDGGVPEPRIVGELTVKAQASNRPDDAPLGSRSGTGIAVGADSLPAAKKATFAATLIGMPSPVGVKNVREKFDVPSSFSTTAETPGPVPVVSQVAATVASPVVATGSVVTTPSIREKGTSLGRDIHLPSHLQRAADDHVIVPTVESTALVVRAGEPAYADARGGNERVSTPSEHGLDSHMPWYDQAPRAEDVFEEPRKNRFTRPIGIGVGLILAVASFFAIRIRPTSTPTPPVPEEATSAAVPSLAPKPPALPTKVVLPEVTVPVPPTTTILEPATRVAREPVRGAEPSVAAPPSAVTTAPSDSPRQVRAQGSNEGHGLRTTESTLADKKSSSASTVVDANERKHAGSPDASLKPESRKRTNPVGGLADLPSGRLGEPVPSDKAEKTAPPAVGAAPADTTKGTPPKGKVTYDPDSTLPLNLD